MGFKRPLVRIQSLGPQSTCLKKQVLCFLYLHPEPAASAPKARLDPPPGGQPDEVGWPLVRIQSLGPNNDNPNYMIQVGNVFGFIISIENVL